MPDSFQSIQSGQGELKDYYGESMYEALRRRRKKNAEKFGLDEDTDEVNRDKIKDPETK